MHDPLKVQDLIDAIGIHEYGDGTVGVLLTGSFARGTATRHSDVDLIVSSAEICVDGQRVFRHCGKLVNLEIQSRDTLAAALTDPRSICRYLAARTHSVPLVDQDGFLQDLLKKARNFEWTTDLIFKAQRDAASELVSWLEEVHKGIVGLESDDSGRLLQAVHGCSWGMLRVAQLHHRVLENSDNRVVDDVMAAMGSHSTWSTLLKTAIGITGASLAVRVEAGLRLFCATCELVQPSLLADEMRVIEPSLTEVQKFLASRPHRCAAQPTVAHVH